jgi:hypothetical protein
MYPSVFSSLRSSAMGSRFGPGSVMWRIAARAAQRPGSGGRRRRSPVCVFGSLSRYSRVPMRRGFGCGTGRTPSGPDCAIQRSYYAIQRGGSRSPSCRLRISVRIPRRSTGVTVLRTNWPPSALPRIGRIRTGRPAFAFKGKPMDIPEAGRSLSADAIVEVALGCRTGAACRALRYSSTASG